MKENKPKTSENRRAKNELNKKLPLAYREWMKYKGKMPIFEYKCEKCGHKFEIFHIKEENVKCPKCGGLVKRIMSKFGFRI